MLRAMNSGTPRVNVAGRKRLLLEALEARRLLAGNVSVDVVEGDLWMRGDRLSNLLEVRQAPDAASAILIRGLEGEDGELTTINGQETVTVDGVIGDLVATLLEGNDFIYIHDVDLPGNLLVRSGPGDDAVGIGGLPRDEGRLPEPLPADGVDAALAGLNTSMSQPDELVPIDPVPVLPRANVTIAGSTAIASGQGEDAIAMGSVEISENLIVNSGRHNDRMTLGLNELPGGPEEVAVSIVGEVPGVSLPLDVFGSIRINTGGGDDHAWLQSVHVAENMRVNLGSGNDVLSYDWGVVSGRIAIDSGAGNDIVALAHVITEIVVIHTRGGSDGVGLFGVSARRLNVNLGRGNDQMIVADTSAATARFNGAAGIDSLEFQGINHLPSLQLLNFEIIS